MLKMRYSERYEEFLLFQRHNSSTALMNYVNLQFTEDDKNGKEEGYLDL